MFVWPPNNVIYYYSIKGFFRLWLILQPAAVYSTAQFKLDYTRVHQYASRHVSQIDRDSACVCTRKKYVTYCTTAGDARVYARYVQFVGVFSLNCTRALDTSAILCTPKDWHTRAFSLARHVEGHPSCRLYLPYRICCTQ